MTTTVVPAIRYSRRMNIPKNSTINKVTNDIRLYNTIRHKLNTNSFGAIQRNNNINNRFECPNYLGACVYRLPFFEYCEIDYNQ